MARPSTAGAGEVAERGPSWEAAGEPRGQVLAAGREFRVSVTLYARPDPWATGPSPGPSATNP
ncbi:hypothetical protein ACFCZ1_08490 [Streptomyces sp. NPDC056224]|uniref:hypothetical protein n=1 Tax=Streptomyces sp. NPDC056224 TaxID=3345750 RepID=UPI0035E028AC